MSSAIYGGTGATPSALLHDGAQVVQFGATGITQGAGRRLAQVQTFTTGAVATGTTAVPLDDTIPQSNEGDQYLSLSITPTNAASTLEVDVLLQITNSLSNQIAISLFQDSNVNALAVMSGVNTGAGYELPMSLKFIVAAGTTSATTFKVRGGAPSGTTTVNGSAGVRRWGGVVASRITIKEYLP